MDFLLSFSALYMCKCIYEYGILYGMVYKIKTMFKFCQNYLQENHRIYTVFHFPFTNIQMYKYRIYSNKIKLCKFMYI